MVERGEVRLDEPVARLLGTGAVVPSAGGREITLEHLATHTSGLPRLPNNMAPRDIRDPYASYGVAELEAFLRGYTLPRAPGERVEYSNLGYGLLGHALSVRAGRSLAELYAARLTAPLAMGETWSVVPPAAAARFVAGHAGRDTAAHWTFDVIAGAGVLRSSAADMLRYLDALLAPDAATPLGRALRTVQGQRVPVNPMVAVGLGWHRLSRPAGPLVWHNGGTGGFRSMAVLDSTRRRAVIVLASTDASMDDIGIHLLDPSFPLTEPPPLPEPLLKRAPKEPDAR